MPTLDQRKVAILEDDPDKRERWAAMIKWIGGIPIPLLSAPTLPNLEHYLDQEAVSLIVCDHHLREHGDYATYLGAQAVAQCYKHRRGGVLVTGFEQQDAESNIREYRRWIPVLLHPNDVKQNILGEKLLQAEREVLENKPPRERIPYRTIMTVQRIDQIGHEKIVKVMMSQWNPSIEVGFPFDMLPNDISAQTIPGNLLIAQVNIEAEQAEDLFFDQFELPNPDVLRKSQALFGDT